MSLLVDLYMYATFVYIYIYFVLIDNATILYIYVYVFSRCPSLFLNYQHYSWSVLCKQIAVLSMPVSLEHVHRQPTPFVRLGENGAFRETFIPSRVLGCY